MERLKRPFDRGTGAYKHSGPLALDNVSFDVAAGESFALVGRNGAGKTTALKLIARISPPSGGRMRVRGRVGALIEVGSGLHPELTGRENIWLYGQILGLDRAEVRSRLDAIVSFADLDQVLDRQLKMYSSGMQLRLGFGIASHLDPDILVVDEALALGDAAFQVKFIERITSLCKEGRTLIFVSHTLPLVRELCRRGAQLDEGRLVSEGPIEHVLDDYLESLSEVMSARHSVGEAIEVVSVRAYPESAERTPAPIVTDGPVRLNFGLSVSTPIDDAMLGVGISDGRGGNLVSMSMLMTGETLRLEPGRYTFTCSIESLPLLPNAYELWFAAGSRRTGDPYTLARPVGTLFVSEAPSNRRGDAYFTNTPGFGPVHVEHRFMIERNDTQEESRSS